MGLLKPASNINPAPRASVATVVVAQSALVPQEGPVGTIADIEKGKPGTISVYIVRAGDTLGGIAKLFGVSKNTILWANDLSSTSVISPGDKLTILPVAGINYKIQKGDTLASIAKRHGGDATDIGSFNGVDDSSLVVGSTILIPEGEPSMSVEIATSTTKKVTNTKTLAPVVRVASSVSEATGTRRYGPEPAHNVGPIGSASEVSYYTAPLADYVRTQGIHGYNAVDLAAPSGTPIMAAAAGTVVIVKSGGWNGGYGSYVVIDHDNGSQTMYAHMSRVAASTGDTVAQGDVIGYVGRTGEATGNHVHFELRNGIKNPF
jgi:murein DD-endopeptidase MepM/ murein hydrolase activator NlpD